MAAEINRVAVVGATRTPFVKAGGAFIGLSMLELGAHAVRELLGKYGLEGKRVDELLFSTVLLDPRLPNWAREICYAANLPKTVYAHSLSNNCISGLVAISSAAERIALGHSHCIIAGGSESMSNPALLFSASASEKFLSLSRARSLAEKLKIMAQFRPKHFLPKPPSPTEPSTGLTMGEHMEITAKAMNIERLAQDEIALRSHLNAQAATERGHLTEMIAPLLGVGKDLLIRADTTAEKLASLKPVFDRSSRGTLTAGNSSALTDGASAVLLMSEERARQEKREVLAYVTDYQYSAIDANDGLLMAPCVAVPRLLQRHGLRLSDFDLVEVHEAFGAQVVANIRAWENGWKEPAIGSIESSRLNVLGGSIAIGHPFAATGGRIVGTLARELQRRNLRRGLISICAAGAMAGAMLLTRD